MAASIEKMEFDIGVAAAAPPKQEPSWEYHLRKYLMLLATLVATATYAAGLSPPGGVWQESGLEADGKRSHEAGDPILYHSARYLAFFYFNATAFAASLVVNLLLLVLNERRTAWLAVLRLVMVLDLLGLMGAFATGSCEDTPTTAYVSTLVVALAAYVGVHILLATYAPPEAAGETSPRVVLVREDDTLKHKEQRKVLLLLATFATGISYAAGLSPPGGFRDAADAEGGHKAGDPMLKAHQSARLMAFFYCNTTAFVASLLIIVLLLGRRLRRYYANLQLYGFILVVLLGLLGAYVAGSSRKADTMAYVLVLVAAVLVYILLVMVVMVLVSKPPKSSGSWRRLKSFSARASHWLGERGCHPNPTETQSSSPARELRATLGGGGQGSHADGNKNEGIEKAKSLILLLATLAATITYQAGMDPPGGVWSDDDKGEGMVPPRYKAGDPILLFKQAARYKAFFYCNSTAFVASLVVILMVQNKSLMRGHALEVAMILDLFGLIGAYAAGSCREVSTSIYVVALAGAVLVYVVIHVVFFTLDNEELSDEEKRKIDKRRKRLLLLAILVATITYQAGLTPPGGFWTKDGKTPDDHDYSAGSPVLEDHDEYRRRYLAFFYCNSTSFMASMALIVMLVNPNLYRPGIRCYALYVCMVVALLGLMGAYAAGCARQLRTSIYVFVLVGAVVAFIVVQLLVYFKFFETCAAADGGDSSSSGSSAASSSSKAKTTSSSRPRRRSRSPKPSTEASSSRRKYLMLLAILAASVTYQAGLKPPGGVLESVKGEVAGNPVLRGSDLARFRAFFYCNSASFVASVVVIVLLLQESLQDHGLLLYAMNTAIVLDLLGLLGAYAAGSSREWGTSGYVLALAAAVIAYVGIHLVLLMLGGRRGRGRVTGVPELPAEPKETRRCSSSPC